jgi:predicted DNA-binding protein (UPF0251 family)/predicted Fe-Mo cluster-binding NifX family protein
MPRPQKCRRVERHPSATFFKPQGRPLSGLAEAVLSVDGFEAIRLADHEGLPMDEAAERMGVSRHTFGRILAESRSTLARVLVEGLALRIEGGVYALAGAQTCTAFTQEERMSHIAVTSEGPTLDDPVDPRFGRAAGFVVVDPDTMEARYVDNGESQTLSHGAGIQAAQRIADAGATVLLTGYVGPKAFQALTAAGIKVGQNVDGMSVVEAVEKFKAGQVGVATEPNR